MLDNLRRVFRKPDDERQRRLKEELDRESLEKKDIPAMILSAYLVFIPVVIGLLLVFALVAWLFVR